MALNFGAASGQYGSNGTSPVTAYPVTIACWFLPTDITQVRALMSISGTNSNTGYVALVTNSGLEAVDYNGNASLVSSSASNVWHHAAGVFTSSTSRTGYLDGTAGTPNTGSSTYGASWNPGITAFGCIALAGSGVTNFFDGSIAEAAIWNIVLAAKDITALANGLSPLSVRPDALVGYWPLLASAQYVSPDYIGRRDLTLGNGPVPTTHPRIIKPKSKSTRFKTVVHPINHSVQANPTPQAASVALRHGLGHQNSVQADGTPQSASLSLLHSVLDYTKPVIQIGGVIHTQDVQFDTLRIDQRVGEEPDQCTFTTVVTPSFVPTVGTSVVVALGSVAPSNVIFSGTILCFDQIYKDVASNVAYDITCQDYTFLLNARRPLISFVATTASTILGTLLTDFSSGIGLSFAASNLTLSLNFDGNAELGQCVTRVTGQIGAHWIMVGTTLTVFSAGSFPGTAPATINASNIAPTNPNGARQLKITSDESQIRNKIYVEGGGGVGAIQGTTTVTAPGQSGAVLPVTQSAGFSGGGACIIYYPIAGAYPAVTQKYFCTFSSVNRGGFVNAPVSSPTLVSTASGGQVDAQTTYWYAYATNTSAGQTGIGPTNPIFIAGSGQLSVTLNVSGAEIVEQDVTSITIYRSYAASHGGNSGALFSAGTVARPAGGGSWPNPLYFTDSVNDSNLGGSPSNTAGSPCPQGALQQSSFAITNLPSLNGVSSLTGSMPTVTPGAAVNVAGLYDGSSGSPYGAREYWISDNECVTPAECAARALAEYNLFGQPIVEASYQTRDINTRAGKSAVFSLPAPTNFSNSLLMQTVTITQFGIPFTSPLYQVKASSVKFTLQDLMRRLGGYLTVNGVVVAAG